MKHTVVPAGWYIHNREGTKVGREGYEEKRLREGEIEERERREGRERGEREREREREEG